MREGVTEVVGVGSLKRQKELRFKEARSRFRPRKRPKKEMRERVRSVVFFKSGRSIYIYLSGRVPDEKRAKTCCLRSITKAKFHRRGR